MVIGAAGLALSSTLAMAADSPPVDKVRVQIKKAEGILPLNVYVKSPHGRCGPWRITDDDWDNNPEEIVDLRDDENSTRVFERPIDQICGKDNNAMLHDQVWIHVKKSDRTKDACKSLDYKYTAGADTAMGASVSFGRYMGDVNFDVKCEKGEE